MKQLVLILIQLFYSLYVLASFPVVSGASDPTTDSWNFSIIVFWLLVIIIPIVLIRIIKKK